MSWTNDPPTANAGDDQDAPMGQEVTLDGTRSSDPDGSALTYFWEKTDGPEVTLSDLARLQTKPDSISLHQSLARTYRQRGDQARTDEHLREALRLALAGAAQNPESASAAYWLGRTYNLMGQHKEALNQFQKAYRLSPDTAKYQKVYLRLENNPSANEG